MELGKLVKSKVVSDSIKVGTPGNLNMTAHGSNTNTFNVPFASGTAAATNETTDADDN